MASDINWMFPVFKAVSFIGGIDFCDILWWRTNYGDDPDEIHWFFSCSDTFAYASADCEEIFPEDVDDILQAFSDVKALDEKYASIYAADLWIARKRKCNMIKGRLDQIGPQLQALFAEVEQT